MGPKPSARCRYETEVLRSRYVRISLDWRRSWCRLCATCACRHERLVRTSEFAPTGQRCNRCIRCLSRHGESLDCRASTSACSPRPGRQLDQPGHVNPDHALAPGWEKDSGDVGVDDEVFGRGVKPSDEGEDSAGFCVRCGCEPADRRCGHSNFLRDARPREVTFCTGLVDLATELFQVELSCFEPHEQERRRVQC